MLKLEIAVIAYCSLNVHPAVIPNVCSTISRKRW